MADVQFFIRQGWNNVIRQRTIWLFSALLVLAQLLDLFVVRIHMGNEADSTSVFILIQAILSFINLIAVPYLAYSFATGRGESFREALFAVRRFAARIIGCSCIGSLILFPYLFVVVGFALERSTQPPQLSNIASLMVLPAFIFIAVLDFTILGFFAHDWGIRQSISNAWRVFTAHFTVLVILGITMTIIFRLYYVLSGILTVLIQSGFERAALSQFNLLNPSASLSNDLIFLLLSGLGQIIFTPFYAAVFVLAYLKYGTRIHTV